MIMKTGLQPLAVILIIGCFVAVRFMAQGGKRKPKILPPPRSKSTERLYQETNSVARLFIETVSLKECRPNWSTVLKELNAEDEPRIRTLLLEMRDLDASSTYRALEAVEAVCIKSKQKSERLTRVELLERAKSRMQRFQS